ncbi:ComF family protein [Labilibacter sediminis]|nr:ComF family protein [Labilibacter sediminis]
MIPYLSDFFNLFFPKICLICSRALHMHEKHICKLCERALPRSYFHMANHNPVEKLFWGRVNIEKASSYLLYTKESKVKNILHSLKYRQQKELGYELGKIYARDLSEVNYFKNLDFIVPVPLHPRKFKERGYNQSEWIAKGLSEVLSVPLKTDLLFKSYHTSTQTRKGRYQRWENVEDVFNIVSGEKFEGCNILLVDDVLTTGATLEACAKKLKSIKDIKINVATLAYASI